MGEPADPTPVPYLLPHPVARHILGPDNLMFPDGIPVAGFTMRFTPDDPSGFRYQVEADLPPMRLTASYLDQVQEEDDNGFDLLVTTRIACVEIRPVTPPVSRPRPEPVPIPWADE